jgi:Anti-sigma-K factor rskA
VSDEHERARPQDGHCGDAAIYLLGLLDARQESAFLTHARSCSVCGDELLALAPAVERLPATVEQRRAPEHVKRHVMAVVDEEADQRKRTAQASDHSLSRDRIRGRFAARRAKLALAGAGLLAAGIAIGGLSRPFDGGKMGSAGVAVQAPRADSADVTLAGASATLHRGGGHTWLTVSHMPEPKAGDVYEVWVKDAAHALPEPTDSLFAPTATGAATVYVPHGAGTSEVLVTQEPRGGSLLPTSAPVIIAHLS